MEKVDHAVLAALDRDGEATFWVDMKRKANLENLEGAPDSRARGKDVLSSLKGVARVSQSEVKKLIAGEGGEFVPFFISNTLKVTGDEDLVRKIAARDDVAGIEPDEALEIPEPVPAEGEIGPDSIAWGVGQIRADDAWSTFGARGEDVVIANIDTGVDFNHPALVRQYRGNRGGGVFDHNYNWFDPSAVCPAGAPCDNNRHGTHTMGTMVGEDESRANQIGVAPGATWIAAKGCESSSCSTSALLASGEWILAPTDLAGQNPRPDLRPNIVNNSWGGNSGSSWYEDRVRA